MLFRSSALLWRGANRPSSNQLQSADPCHATTPPRPSASPPQPAPGASASSPAGPSPDDGRAPQADASENLFEDIAPERWAPEYPAGLCVAGLVRNRQLAFEAEPGGGPIAELLQGHQVQASPKAASGAPRLGRRASGSGQTSLVGERQALFRCTENDSEDARPDCGRPGVSEGCSGVGIPVGGDGDGHGCKQARRVAGEDEVIMTSEQPKIISHAWLALL